MRDVQDWTQGPKRQRASVAGDCTDTLTRLFFPPAKYFEQHDIRGRFTALTQLLMVHQPADALRFMHNEIGRLIDEQDQMCPGGEHDQALTDGACLVRVHAEVRSPEGTRKKTFSKLVLAGDTVMRQKAEQEAARMLHDVMWDAQQVVVPPAAELPHATTARKRVSLNRPSQHAVMSASSPSAPSLSGYEMGVLLCTYAALGWKNQLEDILESGVDVNTGDYDKRTALHLAASEGHADVVEALILRNANVNVTDRMGFSPLVDACRHNHLRIQNLLREAGGQVLGMDVTVAVADEYVSKPAPFKPRQVEPASPSADAKGNHPEEPQRGRLVEPRAGGLKRVPSDASPRSRARMLSPFRFSTGHDTELVEGSGVATEVLPSSADSQNHRRFDVAPTHLAAPPAFLASGPAFQGGRGGATGGPRRFQSVRRF